MRIFFAYSSALVKRYALETRSAWLRGVAAAVSGNSLILARITPVEVTSALARRQREGAVSQADVAQALAALRYHLSAEYQIVELDQALAEAASDLILKYPLRAYDAVQLASALRVESLLTQHSLGHMLFLSADSRLLSVAEAEGLAADNPILHP